MKRILVPTDLSEIAERGLRLAVEIAKRTNAEIYLINFISHPFGKTFSAMGIASNKVDEEEQIFNIELLQANHSKLNLLAAHFAREGVELHTEIVDDELKDGIDQYLRQHNIDLVVMGTSGEENMKEQFTGNHTENVISISSCPVISVRDGFDISNFNSIVLALDIDVEDDTRIYAGMRVLKELADYFHATIHLVYVSDPLIRMEENLKNFFSRIAERFSFTKFDVTILRSDDEAGAVADFARSLSAGFVAVFKNHEDGIFRIFSDHFSDRVVKEVGRPVFTYNLQNA